MSPQFHIEPLLYKRAADAVTHVVQSRSWIGVNPVRQILGGKAAERSRITAVAQPVAEMLKAEPAVEPARWVPVKHLKIDPLPAAFDSDGSKSGHQPPSDSLSARRLGDKDIFKIHPRPAEPSREPGVEQGKTGWLAVEKGEQRLELSFGSEAIAAQIFFGGDDGVGRPFVSG